MGRTWFIYGLLEPETRELRYVGWTTNTKRRLSHHMSHCDDDSHRSRWIKHLLSRGTRPLMTILESGTGDHYKSAEIAWIWLFRNAGFRLTNMTDGGDGILGYSFSKKHRQQRADLARGRVHSAETREKIGASTRTRVWPEYEIERRREFMRHRKITPESIEKIRKWHTGRKLSEETRRKLSELAKKRPPQTQEKKDRIAATMRIRAAQRPRGMLGQFLKAGPASAQTGRKLNLEVN